jgi:hypothetical protein
MNFLKSISLSWKGLSFKVRNSIVLIPLTLFNWSVTPIDKSQPYSNSAKLSGFGMCELVTEWVASRYPKSHVIVLTNINVSAKNITFWAKVPKPDMVKFLRDIVVLQCKDGTELKRLIDNIPSDFADAWGFYKGQMVDTNGIEYERE